MPAAVIGGTGIYSLEGVEVDAKQVENEYGIAQIYVGKGEHEDE